MKKWLCRVTLIGALILCGCGQVNEADDVEMETSEVAEQREENSELDGRQEKVNELTSSEEEVQSGAETQSNTKEEQKDASEITSQVALIVSEKDIWLQGMDYANDMVGYTITDMDSNGRLELIAANCGGTGHYTYSRFFEVNETYDGLTLCGTNFQEGDSQPDIMSNGEVIIVYEDAQGIRYYLFEDMLHDVADYYYVTHAVSLQNGTISGTPLAINRVSYGEVESSPAYTYMTGDGELISQEEYTGLIGGIFNEEFRKYVVNWTWLHKQMVETVSDTELEELLLEAYEAITWNAQEELSHYGKWKVEACVGYAKVSAVSKEEADSYIGKELTYTQNEFNFEKAIVNLSKAGYGYLSSTREQFMQNYNVSKLDVEIPEELVWCSALTEGSYFGAHFATIADDRLLIYYEGAFFEAVRVETSQADFTMEQVEMLAEKINLTLADLTAYEGLQQSSLLAVDYKQYYYDFIHENKPYRLEFRSNLQEELQFVRLVDMETMLNIDIRTGNVEHLLNNTVAMADYLTCDLPEGVTANGYDLYQGHFGGEELIKNGENCGGIYILDSSKVKPGFSGDELLNVANYENNIFHEEVERLSLSGVPALLTFMTVEEENGTEVQYYSIYFAKEPEVYCYNIRLRTDMFTKDEVLNVANSVVFESRAFAVSEFTFADVSDLEFFFCSGAGGWWTQMYIHEDGTFDGYYVDSNWGITDEDYPNGQVSYSEFYGNFTEPLRVDDYTYQVKIDSIEYPKGKGSEIIDGVLYDYGEAYGLQGGENFNIYLPGKKYQELPEDFRLWVNGHYHWTWNGDIEAEDAILPFYGFFNVEQGCGFYSYEKEKIS